MEQIIKLVTEHLGDIAMTVSAILVFLGMKKDDKKKLIKRLAKMRCKAQKQVEKLKQTNETIENLEKETEKDA